MRLELKYQKSLRVIGLMSDRVYKTTEKERERARQWRLSNPERCAEYQKRYRQENLEKLNAQSVERNRKNRQAYLERNKRYRERHPERVRANNERYKLQNKEKVAQSKARYKAKLLATSEGRLNSRISAQVRGYVARGVKEGKSFRDMLGWTIDDLKSHLEKQFVSGMGWHNMSEWHIDHIIPLSHFLQEDEFDVRAAWALTNLRPLWAKENQSKGGRRFHLL